ncbi:hypothetical protein GCM10017567_59360 [Amycolatopsis bullii]|uniref:Uncharacterized protein n=1 Tax=Amycolatopsis bullii TaxID=941987 RepID=A0ABQ3KM72_9PSEU|nr:hypothetical protein GCM10017567_59360 [Amycolatopsis bullii]
MVCLATFAELVLGSGTLGPAAAFAMPVVLTIVITKAQVSTVVSVLERLKAASRIVPPGTGRSGLGDTVVRPISPEVPGTQA